MAGLISTRIDPNDPLKSIAGYDPERLVLDPKLDTVQGQIEGAPIS